VTVSETEEPQLLLKYQVPVLNAKDKSQLKKSRLKKDRGEPSSIKKPF